MLFGSGSIGGNGIMALFAQSPRDALQAAIDMQKEIAAYNCERVAHGQDPIRTGVGVHVGHLMLGTVGEADRMDATVISDVVNLASRLEGLTKIHGAHVIASEEVFDVK